MKSGIAIAAVAGLVLTSVPGGSASNGGVVNVAKASSNAYRHDNAAISQALKRLNLSSLSSVDALVETGFSMKTHMTTHTRLLARTAASTKAGRAGRSLVLRGLTALAASGDYMLRYGRALGSGASLSVLQIDSDGYRIKRQEGERLARRGAALLGFSFG
jgi:hypothetical protein